MNNKILVVEDNPFNLELVTDLLEVAGLSVASAGTAEEGLRLAREISPGLILMDLSLPGMGGLAAIQALKADPATSHLTVIALTAHAMKGDKTTAFQRGCDGYLTKPIDTRTFATEIAGFLAQAKIRRVSRAAA